MNDTHAASTASASSNEQSLSIWFFVGVTLGGNGLLIVLAGLYSLVSPPENKVVLYNLHADLWWGAVLLVLGIIYVWRFGPWRTQT